MGYRHRVARVNNSRQRKQRPGVGVLICTEEEDITAQTRKSGAFAPQGISECSQVEGLDLTVHFVDPSVDSLESPPYSELLRSAGSFWSGLLLLYPP